MKEHGILECSNSDCGDRSSRVRKQHGSWPKHKINVALYESEAKRKRLHAQLRPFGRTYSNSLKQILLENGAGLLKAEMRLLGSLVTACADQTKDSAGGALAVDRVGLPRWWQTKLRKTHTSPLKMEEITKIPRAAWWWPPGLLSNALFGTYQEHFGNSYLYFYDAAAPIVTLIPLTKPRCSKKHGMTKGTADYINCPHDKGTVWAFYRTGKRENRTSRRFENNKVFEGCMPLR